MPRGRPRKRPSITGDLQRIANELAALTERVREAEAVKMAIDGFVASAAKPRAKPGPKPGSRRRTSANGRRKAANGRRRGRPPGSGAKQAAT